MFIVCFKYGNNIGVFMINGFRVRLLGGEGEIKMWNYF